MAYTSRAKTRHSDRVRSPVWGFHHRFGAIDAYTSTCWHTRSQSRSHTHTSDTTAILTVLFMAFDSSISADIVWWRAVTLSPLSPMKIRSHKFRIVGDPLHTDTQRSQEIIVFQESCATFQRPMRAEKPSKPPFTEENKTFRISSMQKWKNSSEVDEIVGWTRMISRRTNTL